MATKKTAPKKVSKPVKKAAPAKKAAPVKKAAKAKSPVNKNSKPKPLAKKAAPVKKVVPVKKAAPVKKAVVSKKSVPAKKAAPAKKAVAAKKPVPVKKAAPAKKAAPVKKAVVAPKVAPTKKAPTKAVPTPKVAPKKSVKPTAPAKPQPKAKTPVAKSAPVKAVPSKGVPSKGAPSKGVPPKTSTNKAGKKIPLIAPEIRFAQTSKPPASPTEIRKALRAKEVKKDIKPVAMPKIIAKTTRKYEPEFTKSVLDPRAAVENTGPTQRYSDPELLEFKELIQNKLNAAKQELAYLNGLITRKDAMSGEDSDSRYMTMEDGSLSMEREQLSQMASRQIDFIEKLEKAMMRIENKTYGICRVTGKLIDKARLRAVPHATLSMEAKTTMNRPGNGGA
jgi:RNA polymerase-binding transcription factor DksA